MSNSRLRALAACCLLLAATARGGDEAERARPAGGFTNVTAASGVAAAIERHYAALPRMWMSGLDLVDLDGDGDLDLHLGGHGSPAAAARNDGKGHFTYVDPKLSVPRGRRHGEDLPYPGGEIRLAHDFNGDGKVDLLCAWGDGAGALYLNDCRAGEKPTWNFKRHAAFGPFNRAAALADMDRDGRLDYLQDARRNIAVFLGTADGWFQAKPVTVPGGFVESGFIPADVDADGDLDLLAHGNDKGNYYAAGGKLVRRLLLNDGKMGFTDATGRAGLAERATSFHGIGDLDQDGDLDLICLSTRGHKEPVSIWLNDGKGRFSHAAGAIRIVGRPPHVGYPYWGGAIVTDFDNDARADFIINFRNRMLVFRGTGGGRFDLVSKAWHVPTGAWCAVDEGTCFGDIDGDGDLDIVACVSASRKDGVAVLRNDLPRRRWLRVRPIGADGNRVAAGAVIRLYEPGGLGDAGKLLWYEQVALWGRQSFHSYYCAGAVTERHFGLGDRRSVDVSVRFHPSGAERHVTGAKADTTVVVREQAEAP